MSTSDDLENASITLTATLADESSVLRSIHSDENQLRTLVVVLSLAGGLVLALTLGFGIYLYWYCCSRQRKIVNEKDGYLTDDNDTDSSTTASSSDKPRDKHHRLRPEQSAPPIECIITTEPNNEAITTLAPVHQNYGPAPSAPSAKELDIAEHHICHHSSNGGSSSSTDYVLIYGQHPHYHRHSTSLLEQPPPAYTSLTP
ncbi:hypothetical protein BJV82DRAFT_618737 [Fennellomyces sp. T-0311]|nr:hypothetical protein BJV82DRAFT_618737 [Fennellomyces sp. T-0311]